MSEGRGPVTFGNRTPGQGEQEQQCHDDTEDRMAQVSILRWGWNQAVELLLILFLLLIVLQ